MRAMAGSLESVFVRDRMQGGTCGGLAPAKNDSYTYQIAYFFVGIGICIHLISDREYGAFEALPFP